MEKIQIQGIALNELFMDKDHMKKERVFSFRDLDRAAENIKKLSGAEWFDPAFLDVMQDTQVAKISNLLIRKEENSEVAAMFQAGYSLPFVFRHLQYDVVIPSDEIRDNFGNEVVSAVVSMQEISENARLITGILAGKILEGGLPDNLVKKAIEGLVRNPNTPLPLITELHNNFSNELLQSVVEEKSKDKNFSFDRSVEKFILGEVDFIILSQGMDELVILNAYNFEDESRKVLPEELRKDFAISENIISIKELVEDHGMKYENIRIIPNLLVENEPKLIEILDSVGRGIDGIPSMVVGASAQQGLGEIVADPPK